MLDHLEAIIKGSIDNDHKCQKIIYEQYRAYALKVVFRYIFNYEKAVDVVNDGFVKLFKQFHTFKTGREGDTEKMLLGWLKKIMINTAIDQLRKNNGVEESGILPEDIWDLTDKTYNADQMLLYKELIILIKKLPPTYRAVFNLYVIDGFSHNEIAGMLNMSEGTSKSNLSRARAILQQGIKNLEGGRICTT
jgi:RNA polymerase sigma-70 factor (ECF subfamily)